MTRLFTDGAERGDLLTYGSNTGGTVVCVSDIKRSGNYSYRIEGGANTAGGWIQKPVTPVTEIFVRFGFYLLKNENVGDICLFLDGTTVKWSLGLNLSSRVFTAKINGSIVATGTINYVLSQWCLVEIHIKVADSGGIFQTKIDGILDIDYSGDTEPSTSSDIDIVRLYKWDSTPYPGKFLYIDDIAINDTNGTSDNSWCGDGKIIMLMPNAVGDVTQLDASIGDNYSCVDERPHNSDTDYVEGILLDYYDLYNMQDSPIPSGSTIHRVWVTAIAKNTVAAGGKAQIGFKTEGTETWTDDLTLTASYDCYDSPYYSTNPVTTSGWLSSEINSLQVGFKIRGD